MKRADGGVTYVPDRKRKIMLQARYQHLGYMKVGERLLHQRMREPHLSAVHSAIARRLDQREEVMISRVADDLLERILQQSAAAP